MHVHVHTHRHTHTQEYYSAYQKEWNRMICSTMNGPGDYYTGSSKSYKDKYIILFTCGILQNHTN